MPHIRAYIYIYIHIVRQTDIATKTLTDNKQLQEMDKEQKISQTDKATKMRTDNEK